VLRVTWDDRTSHLEQARFHKTRYTKYVKQSSVITSRIAPPSNIEGLRQLAARVAKVSGAVKVVVFGSVARGEQTVQSDLDLLLLLPTTERQVLLNAAIEADGVFWNAPYSVDLIPMSLAHYQVGDSVLARRVAREGVVLYDEFE
jgi:predicted nucleotidyltransferase